MLDSLVVMCPKLVCMMPGHGYTLLLTHVNLHKTHKIPHIKQTSSPTVHLGYMTGA